MFKYITYFLRKNSKVRVQVFYIFKFMLIILGYFLSPVRRSKQIIVFSSFSGKAINDSPLILWKKLRQSEKYQEWDFIWAVDSPVKFPEYKTVKIYGLRYFYTLLISKVWITNVDMERGLCFKPNNVFYLNTWHAISLKHIGNSVPLRNDFNWSKVDYLCCSSEYEKEIFINDFKANKDSIKMVGMPRNDVLCNVDHDMVIQKKNKLGFDDQDVIALYAPTWRESLDFGKSYVFDPGLDFIRLRDKYKGKIKIIFKPHPFITKVVGIEFNDFVIDGSSWDDINELYIIADFLISDYSSAFIDYSLLDRPFLCYAPDFDQFCETRGFYVPLNDVMPFGVIKSQGDLENSLDVILDPYFSDFTKIKEFSSKFISFSGEATNACIEELLLQVEMFDREK